MSGRWTTATIREAARDGEGFCLACGAKQLVFETRPLLGACIECYQTRVIPADWIVASLSLIIPDEPDELGETFDPFIPRRKG